jgi:transcriptional regulator with XRE-family HTH domain
MLEKVILKDKVTLKEIRLLLCFTQEEFAKYVQIPYTTYRRFEKGSKIGASELSRISAKTGIPMDKIIF